MTQEHPTKLAISIEESVWLNKGQQIGEILGMSLEPEIIIEERNHHVNIKGGLRLVGEYQPSEVEENIDVDNGSIEEQVSFRSAGEVTLSEDGIGTVTHYFPIDVTIPINRIQNLDDVYVQIESFDYDLPEKSCIQLTADISISGMTHEQVKNRELETKVNDAEKLESVPTAFSFEAKRQSTSNEGISVPPEKESIEKEAPIAERQLSIDKLEEADQIENETPIAARNNEEVVRSSEEEFDSEIEESRLNPTTEMVTELAPEENEEVQCLDRAPIIEIVEEQEDVEVHVLDRAPNNEIIEDDHKEEELTQERANEIIDEQSNEEQTPFGHSFIDDMIENPALENLQERAEVDLAELREIVERAVLEKLNNEEQNEPIINLRQIKDEVPVEEEGIRREKNGLSSLVEIVDTELTKKANSNRKLMSEETKDIVKEVEHSLAEEKETVKQRLTNREENALYLTKMMSKEEEQFTTLKMCIVQENESLETIADRYDISANQLVRTNRLQQEKIEEGQILYIPVK
ncbi:stage VI sporulation protein D [bacterium LRH843]|nr:stage VI sporulation protein D [bacterium LRH843]